METLYVKIPEGADAYDIKCKFCTILILRFGGYISVYACVCVCVCIQIESICDSTRRMQMLRMSITTKEIVMRPGYTMHVRTYKKNV